MHLWIIEVKLMIMLNVGMCETELEHNRTTLLFISNLPF